MADPRPRITVDRIEGARALLDMGGEIVEIPAAALPEGAAEGSPLTLGLCASTRDLEDAEAQLERLKKKSPPKMSFDL